MSRDGEPVPEWLRGLADAASKMEINPQSQPPAHGGRASAVLVLFGAGPSAGPGTGPAAAEDGASDAPDLLFIQRSADLRLHAGQPAFPGGATDPGDADQVATALREANEEVGLDPASVDVQTTLPRLWIPVSGFVVTPVLAWWRAPHPVAPVDPREVELVARVPVAHLADPANRLRVRHPSGWIGAAFRTENMLVWGFTAGVLNTLLEMGGWARPWDQQKPPEALPV